VREAVRVLESMHLVSSRRRVGITVLPSTEWNPFDRRIIRWRLDGPNRAEQLRDLGELRAGIEPTAARLAAHNASGDQCAALLGAVLGMSAAARSGDQDAYLQHDIDFHRTLLTASGNLLFRGLSGVVAEVLSGRTRHDLMPHTPNPVALRLHADVADAIQNRLGADAENAMRSIVLEASEAMAAADAVSH